MGFPGGSVVKNLPAMHETGVQFLGWEDPLKQPTPVLLPAEFYGQRSLAGYIPGRPKESDMTERFTTCATTVAAKFLGN